MMNDIGTVIWKEWKELIARSTQSRSDAAKTILVLAIIVAVIVSRASTMMNNPGALLVPSFVLIQLLSGLMADSFAGERERHTLETLLASRLSDLAILIGKLLSGVLLAGGLMVGVVGLGFVSSMLRSDGQPLPYSAADVGVVLGFYLLVCLAMSCAAVLVSLRAPTVRHAIQMLTWSFMIVFFLSIMAISKIPPEWRITLLRFLAGQNLARTELIVAAVLVSLILVLFGAARLRFQRARLILD